MRGKPSQAALGFCKVAGACNIGVSPKSAIASQPAALAGAAACCQPLLNTMDDVCDLTKSEAKVAANYDGDDM